MKKVFCIMVVLSFLVGIGTAIASDSYYQENEIQTWNQQSQIEYYQENEILTWSTPQPQITENIVILPNGSAVNFPKLEK